MSHHHVVHLDADLDPAVVGDAIGQLAGLAAGRPVPDGVAFVRRWDDDPGWVEVTVTAPDGAQLRNRSTEITFDYLHLDSPYDRYPDEPPAGRPKVQAWGRDPFAFAVLDRLARRFGGTLVVNDDWRPDATIRVDADPTAPSGPVSHADVRLAAERIQQLYGPSPHRLHVPALARRDVPAFVA